MFSDTITLTIYGIPHVLNRISQDKYSSEYFLRASGGETRMRIRNTSYIDKTRNGGLQVDRHNIEVVQKAYPTEARAHTLVRKFYAVFEVDQGDLISEIAQFVAGCNAFLSEANATKMANWES